MLLTHYLQCSHTGCRICGPVRLVIKKTKKRRMISSSKLNNKTSGCKISDGTTRKESMRSEDSNERRARSSLDLSAKMKLDRTLKNEISSVSVIERTELEKGIEDSREKIGSLTM